MLPDLAPALLALADGTVFHGHRAGAAGHTVGEVVFNTALTGYQEILTDPSYCRQIVTLTYPHIGNTGVNDEDVESHRVFAAGLIVKDVPRRVSNFRATASLPEYLEREGTVAIAGIDTRRLTRVLRRTGAQNGCILGFEPGTAVGEVQVEEAVARARAAASMAGQDLARVVSTAAAYEWTETEWHLGRGVGRLESPRYHVVAYDFGGKRTIQRML
ncbi:MAG: carbamoyl-phosphate synthase domain-containing protein, partial [Betaproteobacteria bacterium]